MKKLTLRAVPQASDLLYQNPRVRAQGTWQDEYAVVADSPRWGRTMVVKVFVDPKMARDYAATLRAGLRRRERKAR